MNLFSGLVLVLGALCSGLLQAQTWPGNTSKHTTIGGLQFGLSQDHQPLQSQTGFGAKPYIAYKSGTDSEGVLVFAGCSGDVNVVTGTAGGGRPLFSTGLGAQGHVLVGYTWAADTQSSLKNGLHYYLGASGQFEVWGADRRSETFRGGIVGGFETGLHLKADAIEIFLTPSVGLASENINVKGDVLGQQSLVSSRSQGVGYGAVVRLRVGNKVLANFRYVAINSEETRPLEPNNSLGAQVVRGDVVCSMNDQWAITASGKITVFAPADPSANDQRILDYSLLFPNGYTTQQVNVGVLRKF